MSEARSADAGGGPLVMKFGGTSVKDAAAIRRLAAHVAARLARQPVVVVSALTGVTDELVVLARDACAGVAQAELAPRVDALLGRHAAEGAQLLDGELRERAGRVGDQPHVCGPRGGRRGHGAPAPRCLRGADN